MTKRVLIVDDDEILCELFSIGFKLADFDVSIVNDGFAAIEFLKHETVDAITLDHDMPGLSGKQVLEQIKAEHIADHTKIIIVSANINIVNDKTYQQLSDHILIKPVGFRQLTQLAQKLIGEND
ncbi:MAG: response regulator [Phototrophicaceae bacterium]